jgi:hypothetical protein
MRCICWKAWSLLFPGCFAISSHSLAGSIPPTSPRYRVSAYEPMAPRVPNILSWPTWPWLCRPFVQQLTSAYLMTRIYTRWQTWS